ncbi:hypothetical protein ACFQPA_12890 [Halomarina halobia]|uniref:DUF8081 domain-containing protein n=1 Tax=Halomarina halobia TaxID=3033386 RepID=A0ABD6A9D4_9EURY|nr:hypothetical protein [Halomarina sp. PSR21]
MQEDGYVVAVKPSARRLSAAAGRWVNERGPRRRFGTKALARRWARELSAPGARLWVQDAVPNDPAPVDGYLVGTGHEWKPAAAPDSTGKQATLDRTAGTAFGCD